jgi:hypothetical protein
MKRVSLLLLGLLISASFINLWPTSPITEPVHALNAFIDPNGDGSTGNWNTTSGGGTYSTEIDEGTRQPTTPTTSDNITAAANNGGTIFQDMTSITGVTIVSQIQVWIYHNDGSNGEIIVQLYDEDESTTRSGTANLTQSTSNAWHSVTFSSLSLNQSQLDTLSVSLTANKNGGGSPATITVYAMYADVTYTNVTTSYEQSAYRLFNSINSTNVGTALAAQDTGAVLNAGGDEFRLRLLLHISDADLGTSGQSFKLQFVGRGSGSCASPSGGTPSTYTDVTGSTAIAYNNLTAGVSDGDALTGNANDPTHGSDTIIDQTVEESNNFTNSQGGIDIGEDGMWDFALVDNTAPAATTYCFRVVESDGTVLDTYTVYPQITTGNGVLAVDILDAGGTPVATPSYALSNTGYLFTCDTTSTSVGTSSQRINVSNYTATASWSLSIAATGGNTTVWSDGGTNTYDYNDASGAPAGCSDGGDTDGVAGQLSIDPSVGTITPRAGCNSTGLTLSSASAFDEGTTDSITLVSASSSAQLSCDWDFSTIDVNQQIPQDQTNANYSINLTLTVVAI